MFLTTGSFFLIFCFLSVKDNKPFKRQLDFYNNKMERKKNESRSIKKIIEFEKEDFPKTVIA